jgi:hypothetical protein
VESREIARQQKAIFLTCKDDVENFYKDVDPKDGGVLKCLHGHENELPPQGHEILKTEKGVVTL